MQKKFFVTSSLLYSTGVHSFSSQPHKPRFHSKMALGMIKVYGQKLSAFSFLSQMIGPVPISHYLVYYFAIF